MIPHVPQTSRLSAYHRDEEGHWVAELSCGHDVHVRHDPPFEERPWVRSAAGRAEHLGIAMECVRCERGEPPVRNARTDPAVPPAELAGRVTGFLALWASAPTGRAGERLDPARLRAGLVVRPTQRLVRCLASVRPARGRATIELHAALLAHPRLLDRVLCHALAHLVLWRRSGPGTRFLGPEWRALVEAAGHGAAGRVHPAAAHPPRRPMALFHHVCPDCGRDWVHRAPRTRARCSYCHRHRRPGDLVVVSVSALDPRPGRP